MELREFIRAIWRRLWLIVLVTVLAAAIAFGAGTSMKPVYKASVTMKVDQPGGVPSAYGFTSAGESLALTYSRLLRTRLLLDTVAANLGLNITPTELSDMVSTSLVPDTQLLELTVKDTDPQRAANIANEIAYTFISLHNIEQQLENITSLEDDLVQQMASVRAQIEQSESAIGGLPVRPGSPSGDGASSSAQSVLSTQRSAYANLLSTYLDIQLTRSQFFDVTVVDPAVPTSKPIRPDIPLYAFLGASLGLFGGGGLALVAEYLDTSLKTSEAVRQVLSLPVLSSIPRFRGKGPESSLVAVVTPQSPAAEAYRALRTNLRFAGVDEPLRTLLVTSPDPGAGKTTTVANLGIAYAQAGLRVVLVDADLRHPSLHRLFELGNDTGLTNLLIGEIEHVETCLLPTHTDNLYVVPSGPVPPNPSELLGSKRMEAVLAEAQGLADLVVLDSPPALPVVDAAVLARIVEGVVMVVEAGRTKREAARLAVDGLAQVEAHLTGTVLNAVPVSRGRGYYKYSQEASVKERFHWLRWGAASTPPQVHQRGGSDTKSEGQVADGGSVGAFRKAETVARQVRGWLAKALPLWK
jgi:succinoglycan biosynthesis transport protein ExoP